MLYGGVFSALICAAGSGRDFAGLHGLLEGPLVSGEMSTLSDSRDDSCGDSSAVHVQQGVRNLRSYSLDEMLQDQDMNMDVEPVNAGGHSKNNPPSFVNATGRPVNGGREGITLSPDRPLPAGPDSPELPAELFKVPVALLDAILTKIPPVDLPVRHFWGDGFLVREMLIPAGTLIVARRYKVPHVCFCTMGEITVWGDGVQPVLIDPPFTIRAEAGVQRVGYTHVDTAWSTVLPNPGGLTDPEAVLDACAEVTPLRYRGLSMTQLLALVEPAIRKLLPGGTTI